MILRPLEERRLAMVERVEEEEREAEDWLARQLEGLDV
jgi:hypothetical protein